MSNISHDECDILVACLWLQVKNEDTNTPSQIERELGNEDCEYDSEFTYLINEGMLMKGYSDCVYISKKGIQAIKEHLFQVME